MKNIFVLGSINMDLVIETPYIPKNGETIKGNHFFINEGGKGANQAVAACKQGVKTFMIGNVGNDVFGEKTLSTLKKYNVDCRNVNILENQNTGIAIIIIEKNNNRIILDSGVNESITRQQIDSALAYAGKNDIFITQLENNLDAVEYGLKLSKEKNMITIFNPAPAQKLPFSIYSYVDYLIVNETECEILTNIQPIIIEQQKRAYVYLNQKGVNKLIITLGENGSVFFDENNCFTINANKINPVDTTAAGDTFVGSFAAQLAKGKNELDSLNYASICSSLTCLRKGAQQSIPTFQEVEIYLNKI